METKVVETSRVTTRFLDGVHRELVEFTRYYQVTPDATAPDGWRFLNTCLRTDDWQVVEIRRGGFVIAKSVRR